MADVGRRYRGQEGFSAAVFQACPYEVAHFDGFDGTLACLGGDQGAGGEAAGFAGGGPCGFAGWYVLACGSDLGAFAHHGGRGVP